MNYTLLLVIIAVSSAFAAKGPYDPEELLFIYSRCIEDHAPDGPERAKTVGKLVKWRTDLDDDEPSHCYFKCVLEMSGVYDSANQKFDETVIQRQKEEIQSKKYWTLEEDKVNAYIDAVKALPPTENVCKKVYDAYHPVHRQYLETSRDLLHGNKELTKGIYATLGKEIRQKDQSYFAFCENKFYSTDSGRRQQLCQIRKYEILSDDPFKQHIDCLMKGVRYITKDNNLNRDEVKRDFKQVNKNTEALDGVLDKCKADEPHEDEEKSLHYYKCLLASDVKDDFKEAFDYREIRSKDYSYNLLKKHVYDKGDIEAKVAAIDNPLCPS